MVQFGIMDLTKCKDFDNCWFEIEFEDVYQLIGDLAGEAGTSVGNFLIENETARTVAEDVNNNPTITNWFDSQFTAWFG